MAAAAARTLTLFGIRNRLIAFIVSAWPTAYPTRIPARP